MQLAAELHAVLLPTGFDHCVHAWFTLLIRDFRGSRATVSRADEEVRRGRESLGVPALPRQPRHAQGVLTARSTSP